MTYDFILGIFVGIPIGMMICVTIMYRRRR